MTDELNEFEARLQITETLCDVLTDLTLEDDERDFTEEEVQTIDDTMMEVSALLLETLQLKVLNVEGGKVTCEMVIPPVAEA